MNVSIKVKSDRKHVYSVVLPQQHNMFLLDFFAVAMAFAYGNTE